VTRVALAQLVELAQQEEPVQEAILATLATQEQPAELGEPEPLVQEATLAIRATPEPQGEQGERVQPVQQVLADPLVRMV
jgi:hypothetical protein